MKLVTVWQKAQGTISTAGTKLNQGLENAAQAVNNELGQRPTPAFAAATVNGGVSSVPTNASSIAGLVSNVMSSFGAVAAGNLAQAANNVENAFSSGMKVALNFVAKLAKIDTFINSVKNFGINVFQNEKAARSSNLAAVRVQHQLIESNIN
jgi:hypothetical protein